MRQTVLTSAIILFFTITGSSQIKKGSILIGGDFSLHFANAKEQNGTRTSEGLGFGISPVFGILVRDNLMAGVKLTYLHSKSENSQSPNLTSNRYGGGIFLRKFKQIRQSDFYFFIDGDLSVGFQKEKYYENTIGQVRDNSSYFSLSVSPGINYRMSRKLLLETRLNSIIQAGYTHTKRVQGTTNPVETTYNSFGMYTSLGQLNPLQVGIKVLLSK